MPRDAYGTVLMKRSYIFSLFLHIQWPKKWTTEFFLATSSNINRFPKFFHALARPSVVLSCSCVLDIDWQQKKNQESPADARVTRDSAVIPRWPSAAVLSVSDSNKDWLIDITSIQTHLMHWIDYLACSSYALCTYSNFSTQRLITEKR